MHAMLCSVLYSAQTRFRDKSSGRSLSMLNQKERGSGGAINKAENRTSQTIKQSQASLYIIDRRDKGQATTNEMAAEEREGPGYSK